MNLKNKKILLGLILVIFGLLTHFAFIWQPAEVVFDEVHYGKAVNEYLRGEYFFTGHPPLGVQLITLGAWLGGYQPHFNFENIGEKFTDTSYIALRFMPNLAGALIPLVVYIFVITLGISTGLSFIIGILLTFENTLLVQSHFVLIDPFLILFGFLGLACFFASRSRQYNWVYLSLAGIFFGMSVAVKWTGLSFILLGGLIVLFDLLKFLFKKSFREFIRTGVKFSVCLFILSFLVYFLTFCVHFKLLPKSGPGDVFMSQEFLRGEKNVLEKFIELNKVNYYSNIQGLTATHPYASKFFTWPFMTRPIFYWVNGDARIYLLGNPIIWYFSTISIFLAIIFLFIKKFKDRIVLILLLGYLVNLLPFIEVGRVTFLYHYLPALIFAIAIMVYLISKIKNSKIIFATLFILAIAAFFYFAPLTYGLNLTPREYENRVWLNSWR